MRKLSVWYDEFTSGIVVQGFENLRTLVRRFARGDTVLRIAKYYEAACGDMVRSYARPEPEPFSTDEWFFRKALYMEYDCFNELAEIIRRSRKTKTYIEIADAILDEIGHSLGRGGRYRMPYHGLFHATREDIPWPIPGTYTGPEKYWQPDVDAGALYGFALTVEKLHKNQSIYLLNINKVSCFPNFDFEKAFAMDYGLALALRRTGANMEIALTKNHFEVDFSALFAILNPLLETHLNGEKEVARILESNDNLIAFSGGGLQSGLYLDINISNIGTRYSDIFFGEKPKGDPGKWTGHGAVLRGPAKIQDSWYSFNKSSDQRKYGYPVLNVDFFNGMNPRGEMKMDLLPMYDYVQQEYARGLATRVYEAFMNADLQTSRV